MANRRLITALALAMPLTSMAAVPVIDSDSAGGASYPPSGYGATGASSQVGVQAPASAQGELFMQLQQMQQEMAQLRGMLEEQQNEIARLKQESLARYQDLDGRLQGAAGGAAMGNAPTANAPAANPNANPAAPAATQAAAQSAAQGPADPAKEKLYYEAAFDLVKAKDFPKAAQAFEGFLRKFPQSQYAGNAQYWLGEVNLVQGNLQAAGQAFAQVASRYPTHAKVPDSLYKLADVEQRLGHADKAKGIYQQVIAQFPQSSAAQLAKRDLQRL